MGDRRFLSVERHSSRGDEVVLERPVSSLTEAEASRRINRSLRPRGDDYELMVKGLRRGAATWPLEHFTAR